MISGVPDRCETEVWRTHRVGGTAPGKCGARTELFYLAEREGTRC